MRTRLFLILLLCGCANEVEYYCIDGKVFKLSDDRRMYFQVGSGACIPLEAK
jgi:hypothetical protein